MDEKLVLALVAALSAIGGVLITQVFTFFRELLVSKRQSKILLREKYELLAEQVGESFLHRVKVASHTGEEFFVDYLNKPIEKIFSQALLYFPELVEPSRNYHNAYHDYYKMLAESFLPDTGLTAAMQRAKSPGENFEMVLDKLDETQKALYECIRKNAPKYARA
ncbi:hypothetical protein ACSVIJ_01740 [Pseudomonas sp. NCHU5208]|uniref:hypothetical protein n=1 Tax=unclassified Pseudomonas TaxID=196821 RepID=UPI003F9CF486